MFIWFVFDGNNLPYMWLGLLQTADSLINTHVLVLMSHLNHWDLLVQVESKHWEKPHTANSWCSPSSRPWSNSWTPSSAPWMTFWMRGKRKQLCASGFRTCDNGHTGWKCCQYRQTFIGLGFQVLIVHVFRFSKYSVLIYYIDIQNTLAFQWLSQAVRCPLSSCEGSDSHQGFLIRRDLGMILTLLPSGSETSDTHRDLQCWDVSFRFDIQLNRNVYLTLDLCYIVWHLYTFVSAVVGGESLRVVVTFTALLVSILSLVRCVRLRYLTVFWSFFNHISSLNFIHTHHYIYLKHLGFWNLSRQKAQYKELRISDVHIPYTSLQLKQ